MVRLLAQRYDTKSGFRSQLQASYVSRHTEELWGNETVCLCIYFYIYFYNSGAMNYPDDPFSET